MEMYDITHHVCLVLSTRFLNRPAHPADHRDEQTTRVRCEPRSRTSLDKASVEMQVAQEEEECFEQPGFYKKLGSSIVFSCYRTCPVV